MQPFTFRRETPIDRRQPAIRWNAVVAGSAVALAIWLLLQLFGSGVALSMLGTRDLDRVHGYGVGTTTWSVLAPLIALFLGGMLSARIAGNHDRNVAGLHGLLVWAFAAFLGVAVVSAVIAAMSPNNMAMTLPPRDLAITAEDLRLRALATADSVGTAFLVTALAIALGAIAAVGGALVAAHNAKQRRSYDTLPGSQTPGHHTAPYPVLKTDDAG